MQFLNKQILSFITRVSSSNILFYTCLHYQRTHTHTHTQNVCFCSLNSLIYCVNMSFYVIVSNNMYVVCILCNIPFKYPNSTKTIQTTTSVFTKVHKLKIIIFSLFIFKTRTWCYCFFVCVGLYTCCWWHKHIYSASNKWSLISKLTYSNVSWSMLV